MELDLTFDKAFELALAVEAADTNAKDLQPMMSPTVICVQHEKSCYCCGDKHSPADSKFRAAECASVERKGT